MLKDERVEGGEQAEGLPGGSGGGTPASAIGGGAGLLPRAQQRVVGEGRGQGGRRAVARPSHASLLVESQRKLLAKGIDMFRGSLVLLGS